MHGTGTMRFPDGRRYTGEWQNGEMHGTGTLTAPKAKPITGRWENGERVVE